MTSESTWNLNMGLSRSVARVARLLRDAGLTPVGEFALGADAVVLLLDTPELLFQAIALDRGAAVLIPVHIVITGNDNRSCVHWVNPLAVSGVRAPASARASIQDMCARVKQTLSKSLDPAVIPAH